MAVPTEIDKPAYYIQMNEKKAKATKHPPPNNNNDENHSRKKTSNKHNKECLNRTYKNKTKRTRRERKK